MTRFGARALRSSRRPLIIPVLLVVTLAVPLVQRPALGAGVVHSPTLVAYYGEPLDLEASAVCSSGACSGVLHWRTTGNAWQDATMTATPPPPADPTSVWRFHGVVPAGDVTTEGVDYWIEVTDGADTAASPTFHTTVLAPTSVVHLPTLTALPSHPIDIEAIVPCSTASCSVTLSYRIPSEGALSEPDWTTAAMTPVGAATPVGQVATVQRYHATIPPEAVTTRGVDYFIAAFDGHTNAYSPGSAYVGTQFAHSDGTGAHYFHVRVTEPVRVIHEPVVVAEWNESIPITAKSNCATGSCSATLAYRSSVGMTDAFDIAAYLDAPFTEVPMDQQVVADADDGGQLLEWSAEIPASVAATEGIDYYLEVTDGDTSAYYPGTTYVAGAGSLDGARAAWQHVEILLRPPTRAITHAPPPVARFRDHVPLRFVATCSADAVCDPTVYLRTTPNEADSSLLFDGEPDWDTVAVNKIAARPQRTGLVAHVFESMIPAEYVDSRGVDYLLKVSNGQYTSYWPPLTVEVTDPVDTGPLAAYHHLHVLGPPAIVHAPVAAAPASDPLELRWHVVCSADLVEQCDTEAYRVDATGASEALPTTLTVVDRAGHQFVLEATSSLPPKLVAGVDEYFLWASDGRTNAYAPGTPYIGGPLVLDGTNTGTYVVYRFPL